MNEQQIFESLRFALSDLRYGDDLFEILLEQKVDNYRTDILIKAGKRSIAAIEIKTSETLSNALLGFSVTLFFALKVRYLVYTDGERFVLYDRLRMPTKGVETNILGFVNLLRRQISGRQLHKIKRIAAEVITKMIREYDTYSVGMGSLIRSYGDSIQRDMKLSTDYTLYFEGGRSDINSFEHQFFRLLLGDDVPGTIYRYCSFGRAFEILKKDEIAMHGLPGMNDTTEPNYVDNYLNGPGNHKEVWEMSPQSRAAINRRFIMSCTELRDDLMAWRLYGEDGKGACLELKAQKSLREDQQFYLGRVKYADENNEHSELELLKRIIHEIRSILVLDFRFVFLYVWRHFFKPRDYEYEKEIRLLYVHRKGKTRKQYIIAEPYSIVNPMVKFDLSKQGFPLTLEGVILGPKKADIKLNRSQLTQMMSEKRGKCLISESTKDMYR